ncbi:MAG: histidine kinase [Bacteroidota bacterium]
MSKAEKYLPFILVILLPAMSAIVNSAEAPELEWPMLSLRYIEASLFLLVIWYCNRWLLNTDNKLKNRVGMEASMLIVNPVVVTLIVLIDLLLIPQGMSGLQPLWLLVFRLSVAALIFNMILRVFKSQKERSALQLQNLALQAENLKFQIETFKQQINPHFLFNSLNTLLDLIEEDQKTATKYVRNFSNLYRVVLQSTKHDFVTLDQELQFLSDYWHLLKVRFKDAIELVIRIDEFKIQYLIPPLSLQFLIENAVKHNEASRKRPLKVEIFNSEDLLIVKNAIHQKKYPVPSEKVGLKNLEQRFSLLYKPIRYGQKNGFFTVQIPLKRHQ